MVIVSKAALHVAGARREEGGRTARYAQREKTITLKIEGAYLECEEGAEVNDLPAAARDHVLPRGLREQPYGLEVDVQDL